MSRSAERWGLAAAVVAAMAALLPPMPAGASPTPSPSSMPTSTRTVFVPQRLPTGPYTPQIVRITPVVVAITVVTEDLEGAAKVGQTTTKLDAILDANILFGKDSDVLQPTAAVKLQEVATKITSYGKAGRLTIDGYTDDLGSAAHGLDLSRRRAAAVETVLRPLLPASIAITTRGFGEANPAHPNDSEANRAKNRRVELHFVTT